MTQTTDILDEEFETPSFEPELENPNFIPNQIETPTFAPNEQWLNPAFATDREFETPAFDPEFETPAFDPEFETPAFVPDQIETPTVAAPLAVQNLAFDSDEFEIPTFNTNEFEIPAFDTDELWPPPLDPDQEVNAPTFATDQGVQWRPDIATEPAFATGEIEGPVATSTSILAVAHTMTVEEVIHAMWDEEVWATGEWSERTRTRSDDGLPALRPVAAK